MTDTVRVPRAWLEAFRRDTDPTEPIADNGGTVWDMFCHEAIAMLAASPQGDRPMTLIERLEKAGEGSRCRRCDRILEGAMGRFYCSKTCQQGRVG